LRADLVDFVSLESMLLADLLDLFIAQHAAGLSNFVFILVLLGRASWVLTFTFLLNLEGGLSSPVLSERIRG